MDPRIRRLIEKLDEDGFESEYLDRLTGRLSVEESHGLLEQEIRSEMAAALGRTAMHLEVALLELEVCERELGASGSAPPPELVDRFNQLRDVALDKRRDLIIHREAIGLRRNDVLLRQYPIPERRRA